VADLRHTAFYRKLAALTASRNTRRRGDDFAGDGTAFWPLQERLLEATRAALQHTLGVQRTLTPLFQNYATTLNLLRRRRSSAPHPSEIRFGWSRHNCSITKIDPAIQAAMHPAAYVSAGLATAFPKFYSCVRRATPKAQRILLLHRFTGDCARLARERSRSRFSWVKAVASLRTHIGLVGGERDASHVATAQPCSCAPHRPARCGALVCPAFGRVGICGVAAFRKRASGSAALP
jgi:hypothetical protein